MLRFLLPLALLPLPAAACGAGETTVLSCTARQTTRLLEVCIAGDLIRYSYGKPGRAPDLSLSEPVATVLHEPWAGVGRSIWEETTFLNEGHAYEVFISTDRMDETHPTDGGVSVTKGGAEVARIDCDPGSATIGLWAVSDAKAARGVCWDPGNHRWGGCSN